MQKMQEVRVRVSELLVDLHYTARLFALTLFSIYNRLLGRNGCYEQQYTPGMCSFCVGLKYFKAGMIQ